ncbi:MAG: serine protease [Verrucomicrobia bacterium]|nr:serine protease [Verrucomicrobiota bacterium]
MTSRFSALAFLVTVTVLFVGCSSPRPDKVVSGQVRPSPIPPKAGEPINPVNLLSYFEMSSTNLLREGRIVTNLLQQASSGTCELELAAASPRALTPEELPKRVEMAVAVIGRLVATRKGVHLNDTATGFFLNESGALVTCWHVVNWDKLLGLTVMTRDGRVCPVRRVLAVSTNYDLAILQVDGAGFTALPVVSPPPQGSPVWVLGHPFPWYYMLTTGIVSGYYTLARGHDEVTVMDITAAFANGSSGAPVINDHGAVVGIAKHRQTLGIAGTPEMTINGCLPSSLLLNMIKPKQSP